MANLLIGSSNLARFYKPEKFNKFGTYQMMKCTTMDSFTAMLGEIEESNGKVIISVFENIISDAAAPAKGEDDRKELIKEAIDKVLSLIESTSTKLPVSKFCIIMPLLRPALEWYKDSLTAFESDIKTGFAKMKSFNVTRVNCVCHSLQQFEKDGVHLTDAAGLIFVEEILRSAQEVFESVNLEDSNAGNQEGKTKTEVENLVAVLKRRFEGDNMMFARIREEIDSTANRSREDRVVVTGITCKDPLPRDNRLRIEKLKTLAAEVFEAIKPGFKGKILYASQGRGDITMPMLEVKLDKVEFAEEIRKAFAAKRKSGNLSGILERIFISNSINVGTRVRIEILKAIAKKITNDQEFAYVVSFISRPIMHIKLKSDKNDRPAKSFTFIDAIKQYGDKLRQGDLLGAYAKAGNAFKGQLEQNFVVLKEDESEKAQTNFHQARIRGRGGARGGSYRGKGGDPNKAPMGTRGVKRPGETGETSATKK